MSVVLDKTGKIWLQCEDPNCPALEHPEDLHSHQIFAGVPLAEVKAAAETELKRRTAERTP